MYKNIITININMDKYLLNAENIDLSGNDILDITNNETYIMSYEDLHNINNIDELFKDKDSVTILYQTKKNYGHWVALIKHDDNNIEFFDSYGLNIDEELKYSEYNLRLHDNNLVPHLSHLLQTSQYNIIHNKIKLQQFVEHVNTCGRHCCVRIKFKKLSLSQYLSLITNNKFYNPDMWVTALTILYSL